ncbi:hypothetical protein B0T26DRAFT_862286 [Lasiosphaeria miniovina]|uniref:arginine--tRNA ligase n=1 Tax=Lasiosphaeria miniovina TaxID=1954250 RepID=A0AA39ZZ07_9PEZI|nr:uncharacterized protein B0T26DRAFT_862286 [Lasiosphaeria miniovina]KAK0706276.1 hypothetical protein B0T26DRAFT_862286 [Lasiosphaeria miniovina]
MATRSVAGLAALVQGLGVVVGEEEEEEAVLTGFATPDVLLHQPLAIYRAHLSRTLGRLVGCGLEQAYDAIQPASSAGNGDLDFVLPKLKLPDGTKLQDLAADVVKKFPRPHPLFLPPFKDGVHVRFFLSPESLTRILIPYILDRRGKYGKKALVEFSSPNLGQDFRTDHLRSTILGAFVANMYEAMGWHVVRINYLGDWGKQIGLLGLGWIKYGSDDVLAKHADPFRYIHGIAARIDAEGEGQGAATAAAADGCDDDDDGSDTDMFAERDATFKRLEDGEAQAVELWEKMRDISIAYYASTYARLGVAFDDYSGESLVCRNPEALARVEAVLRAEGIAEQRGDGSWVVDFAKHSPAAARLGVAVVRARDGTTTYFLRDVATVLDRLEDYSFDKMVYVVGEQDAHFRQVFETARLLGQGDVAGRLHHLSFTRGPAQWGGDARLLGDILDRCEEYVRRAAASTWPDDVPAHLRRTAVAGQVAISSLVVHELNIRNRSHTIGLDVELLTATDGETGPALQLAYARLRQTLSQLKAAAAAAAAKDPATGTSTGAAADYSSLWDAPWIELLRLLARFPNVATAAFDSLEPETILSYLFLVVDELSCCLDVVDDDESGETEEDAARQSVARARLYQATRQVLENGMRLLNITPAAR